MRDILLEIKMQSELERLSRYKKISVEAVEKFTLEFPYQQPDYEIEYLVKILNRIFNAEIDYLERNPEDYFELYEEDDENDFPTADPNKN